MKFTLFSACSLLLFLITSISTNAQTTGDFRSNGTGGGDWQTASTWQTYNGTTWIAASSTPSSTDGVITIQTGDSVTLSATLTVDQIVVQSGAMLAFNGNNVNTTFTLNNNPAIALDNSGRLYLRNNAILAGTGTVTNESGALMKIEASSTVNVATTNANGGEVRFSNTSGVDGGATLTNNGLINWEDNPLYILNGSSIVNNDSFAVLVNSPVNLNTGTGGTLTNASAGVIYLSNSGLNLNMVSNISFSNSGRIRGFGSITSNTTTSNTGTIIPGDDTNPTTLTVGGTLTSGSPTFKINIASSGAVAGTNYSQVTVANGFDLSSSVLTMTDAASSDPVGTTYTVMTATAGSFSNTFATTNLPPSLGNVTVSGSTVTVKRITVLPLTWGSFNVKAAGSQAILNWTTLQEFNTAAFIIERSSDGVTFSPIGTIRAQGNSNTTTAYTFTDANPSQQGYNYYRLQQTDLDGKKSYSQIDVIGFGAKSAVFVQTSPNPVRDLLNITVQADNIMISITDMNGRNLKDLRLNRGFHQAGTSDLAPGIYQLTFYQAGNRIGGQQLIKL